ncbi:MAG: beta-propeller fold lactonase family protein [candidate division WOR-3 bacterium]|nr:beta-propeller fold lactonase family protein [candidate division WOR-3 bacterium]
MIRNFIFVVILIVSLELLYGQWLETTIDIAPDSGTIAFVWNPNNNRLYCANEWTNNVTVIDCATNQIITRIPVGSRPHSHQALALNRINNKVYCANWSSDNVTVINCNTNQVDATIPVGYWPSALLWNHLNNKVYCANNWSDNITVIDGSTNQIDTTIYVGMWPQFFALNTTNNYIYCAVEETDEVVVLDGSNQHLIAHIGVGDSPKEVIWNSLSNKIYSTNRLDSSVTIINGATNHVITTVRVGQGPQFLADNSINNKVYCSNNLNNTISVIDGYDDQVDTTLNMVYSTTWNLLWNRTNNKLYCCLYYPSTVRVINCQTNEIVASIIVSLGPRPLAWDSIDNRVYVGCYDGRKIAVLRDEIGIAEQPNNLYDVSNQQLLAYPNPFRDYTSINYIPSARGKTKLEIFDIRGIRVKAFDIKFGGTPQISGAELVWDGRNDRGELLGSGVYFCKISGTSDMEKVLILR